MTFNEAVVYGFATGLGVETAKVVHEIWIAPYIKKRREELEKLPKKILGKE